MKEAKEVNMATPKKGTADNSKLTYDQLKNIAHQLSNKAKELAEELQRVNINNAFKRLDYLIKVIELSDKIKDSEFTNECIDELKDLMMGDPKEEKK